MPNSVFPLAPFSWELFEPQGKRWLSARVPGCVHLDLRRHELIPDPFHGSNELLLTWMEHEDWQYRLAFELPADAPLFAQDVIDLACDGLDALATVTLNGHVIARTENMFIGYRFPVKEFLRVGRNELTVAFSNPMTYINARRRPDDAREWNDPVGGCLHIRKEQCSFGWDWGPRFPTSGIYRDIRLEGWSRARFEHVTVRQEHIDGGRSVCLQIEPFLQSAPHDGLASEAIFCRLFFDGRLVASGADGMLTVPDPQLWWPCGHGAQPLYTLEVDLLDGPGGPVLDTWNRRVGLRTFVLDRHPDEYGESFEFVVNGRPIFAKGANWIPADSFVAGLTRADYDDLLSSAAAASMNTVRVWGGGIYESENFYDLCDEKGLLVWQDFMFACALSKPTTCWSSTGCASCRTTRCGSCSASTSTPRGSRRTIARM